MTKKRDSNRPHWHVLKSPRPGAPFFFVGVRMTESELEAEREAGRLRVVRRWFNTKSAAARKRQRLKEQGIGALSFQCPPPEDAFCIHGPP